MTTSFPPRLMKYCVEGVILVMQCIFVEDHYGQFEVVKNKVNVYKSRWIGDEFVKTEVMREYDVFPVRPMGPRWTNEDYALQDKHLSCLVYMGNIKNSKYLEKNFEICILWLFY